MLHCPHKYRQDIEPISKALEELEEHNILEFMRDFVVSHISLSKIYKLNEMHNVLLRPL